MTYLELINSFWDSTRFDPCTSNEAVMYFFLLHQCNIRRWINPFEFKTRNLEILLGLSRNSIGTIRNTLKQRGLIDFTKGIGRGSAAYLICGAKITNEELYKKFCVKSEDTKVNTTLNTKVNTNENSTLYIEEKRNKTKDKSPDGDNRASPPPEPSLFAEVEKKTRKKPTQSKSPPSPPTLNEVLTYFLSQDADKRLEDWEESARRFFDYFAAVDWRDKYNRRITRWDSRANSWILDDEKRYKDNLNHEQTRTNGSVSPSSGIPIRGRVTPGCGLKRRDPGGEI